MNSLFQTGEREMLILGYRFRKSIRIIPGVKLNISKSGISTSIGRPGSTLNLSRRGTRVTVGIPGSGLSYSTSLNGKSKTRKGASQADLEATRRRLQNQYGITDKAMRKFEKRVKRNPQRYTDLSENELIQIMRNGGAFKGVVTEKALKCKRDILILLLIILVLAFIASFSK